MTDGGPRVLLIHGLLAASPVWQRVIAAMGDQAQCFAPDLPGHRGEAWPGGAFTLERVLDLLEPIVDEMRPAHLVGHSMGGIIALGLGARRPGRFRSIGVIGLPVYGSRAEGVARIGRRGLRWRGVFLSDRATHAGCVLASHTVPLWEWCVRLRYPKLSHEVLATVFDHRAAAHGPALNAIVFGGLVDELAARQTAPVSAFHGGNDTAAPVEPVEAVAERFGWDLFVEAGGNHQVIVERPQLVAAWIRSRVLGEQRRSVAGEQDRHPVEDGVADGKLVQQGKPLLAPIPVEDRDLVGGGPEA